jgi:hypothetical protein
MSSNKNNEQSNKNNEQWTQNDKQHRITQIVLKSGSLNLLEPSGYVQACDGIALPFLLF